MHRETNTSMQSRDESWMEQRTVERSFLHHEQFIISSQLEKYILKRDTLVVGGALWESISHHECCYMN